MPWNAVSIRRALCSPVTESAEICRGCLLHRVWRTSPREVLKLEEDKRATTNVLNGLAFFFSFILFVFRLFELKQ